MNIRDYQPQGLQVGYRYSGRVIDNNDPQRLGKVRVRVEDLHNDVPDEHLPWASPKGWPQWSGAGPETGSFSVPEIGTQVDLVFPTDSPYFPEYHPYDCSADTRPEEVTEDYPHTHLLYRFLTGTRALYNRQRRLFKWFNADTWQGENVKSVTLKVGENVTVQVDGSGQVTIKGSLTLRVEGATELNCPNTTINGNLTVNGIVRMN